MSLWSLLLCLSTLCFRIKYFDAMLFVLKPGLVGDPSFLLYKSNYFDRLKLKEGISNKAPLQHPQQNTKTPQVRTQIQHTQPGTQRLQGTSNTTYNIKHKRLHINQRDQWATGADLGRPSAKLIANGVVIRITCAQPSHSSGCTEVSKNAQLWCKITSSL